MTNTDSDYNTADVFHRIACDAQAIVRSLGHAYDEEDPSSRVDAAIALAGRIGALADAMQSVGRQMPPVDSLHGWLMARA